MRRILKDFRINEISACDKPAVELARVVIMKRDSGGAPLTKGELMDIDLQKLAQTGLELKANEIRKREPSLTEAGAFAKACKENPELLKAERAGNLAKLYPPVADTTPVVGETDSLKELQQLAADFRKQNPFLSPEQCFARIYSDPSNREAVRRERNEAMARLGMAPAAGMRPI